MIETPVIAGLSMCSFGKGVFIALVVSLWLVLLAFGMYLTFGPEIGWGLDRIRRASLLALGLRPAQYPGVTWRSFPIEPGIKPVCDALNHSGYATTFASCEGHFDCTPPYVAFVAHPDFAAAIAREIWEEVYEGEGLLNGWAVEGGFDLDFRLTFTMSSGRHARLYSGCGWSYARLYLQRQRLDREIACLSALIDKAAQRVPHPDSIEGATCSD